MVLAVKPQIMDAVLADMAPFVKQRHLVISIAAGVPLGRIEGALPENTRVVRVMPNTPALVHAGAAAYCPGHAALPEDLQLVHSIFCSVGQAVMVSESLMDAVTGLSGSGPAYVFSFIQGMTDAGVREGLPRPVALELVVQTVLGSAVLCMETGRSPSELSEMGTSPGGTTIAGLYALEKGAFRASIMDAVRAAALRSRELGIDG